MPLDRQQVFEVVNDEREYQDTTYNPDEKTSSGLTRVERDREVIVGIAMLREYVNKASDSWVSTKGSQFAAIQQVAKIAAIAVRVLERAGGSEELLTKGLR